jgi:LacI family transcriptional regulator
MASASNAINGTGSLGEQRRAQILKVAEQLGYRQNVTAKAIRTGRTGTVGLIVPELHNPFFSMLAQAVVLRAREQGYTVIVADTESSNEIERQTINLFSDRGVDGIIWFPNDDESRATGNVDYIPMVVIDRHLPGFECIMSDELEGGRLAAEHLVGLGHQRIGIVSGPCSIRSMAERYGGAARYISRHATLAFHVENGFEMDLEPQVITAIQDTDATAIFVCGDIIAIGVLKLLRSMGKEVPGEISIVGYDDVPWAELSTPALTTIEVPVEDIATEAVGALLSRIQNRVYVRRRVMLDTKLIIRESTAPPRSL